MKRTRAGKFLPAGEGCPDESAWSPEETAERALDPVNGRLIHNCASGVGIAGSSPTQKGRPFEIANPAYVPRLATSRCKARTRRHAAPQESAAVGARTCFSMHHFPTWGPRAFDQIGLRCHSEKTKSSGACNGGGGRSCEDAAAPSTSSGSASATGKGKAVRIALGDGSLQTGRNPIGSGDKGRTAPVPDRPAHGPPGDIFSASHNRVLGLFTSACNEGKAEDRAARDRLFREIFGTVANQIEGQEPERLPSERRLTEGTDSSGFDDAGNNTETDARNA
ncbi:hypothetical protein IscW_ISCW008278 [Ixodes scapularis]|uniref:Uncharacterized protein n=1 Tax=Ixodes scapularis TaxID=6945 RepID=B7PS51_IXOSC|nr:hypothetical protein IscW_ISCW008278 [Ixodes scapularis]|eukprot:XP_002401946.1 hypothetical protein IscW_ISCW008278 [Ixodes scapularis]